LRIGTLADTDADAFYCDMRMIASKIGSFAKNVAKIICGVRHVTCLGKYAVDPGVLWESAGQKASSGLIAGTMIAALCQAGDISVGCRI
jgi:hypothetical protein